MVQAVRETVTPTLYTPPPKSSAPPPTNEPAMVTRLFDLCNGRRPTEYSVQERTEITMLLNALEQDDQASPKVDWDPSLTQGSWQLVFLEPGPKGGGVDRRVPLFPELAWNDQYQIFGVDDTVYTTLPNPAPNRLVNIGQLWGPNLYVRVLGTFAEVDPTATASPKRLQADITSGQVCWQQPAAQSRRQSSIPLVVRSESCLDLPIQGMGLFDSLYLGPRLRTLRNINGTGARGIQIRMTQ